MSHTPGPWRVIVNPVRGVIVKGPNGVIIASRPLCKEWKRNEELYANARLIAAAPEMYEELREMLYYARCVYEQHGGDDEQRGLAPKIKKDIDRVEALLRRVDPEEDEHHDQP